MITRMSYIDMLHLCVQYATAVIGRPLTFDEWNGVNRDVTRYRKRWKKTERVADKWSRE